MLRKAQTLTQLLRQLHRLKSIHEDAKALVHGLDILTNQADQGFSRVEQGMDELRTRIASLESAAATSGGGQQFSPLRPFFGLPAPLYLDDAGNAAFQIRRGAGRRTMVVSVPKSGTYLVGALLEQLGSVPTGVHLGETGFTDYRNRSKREMVEESASMQVFLPLASALELVHDGQFSVGHLRYEDDNVALLTGFRKLFTYREVRASLVSYMRFFMNRGRGEDLGADWKQIAEPRARMAAFLELYGPRVIAYMGSVAPWRTSGQVCPVRYETLMGDDGEEARFALVQKIATAVGIEPEPALVEQALSRAIGAETKTWSGARSRLEEFWDGHCEAIYERLGGEELNTLLGYQESLPSDEMAGGGADAAEAHPT